MENHRYFFGQWPEAPWKGKNSMKNLSARYVCDVCGKVLMFDLVNTFVTFTGYFEPPRQLIIAASDCGHTVFNLENYDEYIGQYRKEFGNEPK